MTLTGSATPPAAQTAYAATAGRPLLSVGKVSKSHEPGDMRVFSQYGTRIKPAQISNHPQFPETSFNPITPVKMRPMQSILIGAAESPSSTIPRTAVPAAPIPVQTA